MPRDIEYERSNASAPDEQLPEGGVKCKNYHICEANLPNWWYDCKGNYLCTNCDMLFGTWKNEKAGVYKTGKGELPFVGEKNCPICLEMKPSIIQPNCDHTICIECFKRCHYGDQLREGEPIFPYSEDIEEEYETDQWNIKWKTHFPLIDKWNREWNEWDNIRMYKYEKEENLRLCPVCRK